MLCRARIMRLYIYSVYVVKFVVKPVWTKGFEARNPHVFMGNIFLSFLFLSISIFQL